ncbi:MAG: biotin-dependent carboxyltransferase family protein [Clostridia bacterium]|nr:biotin-dependent carboxyltransferase family protein [Clostridia bacterium]MBR1686639.1 biotin-dependent carboxyltransferase family protein [Clostridia bacterium]
MALFEVLRPGLLTTVQDAGRTGHAHEGFPTCGAMDPFYYALVNSLCGNAPGAAVLECTALGPKLKVQGRALVAVSPNAGVSVNGSTVQGATPILLEDGDELEITEIRGLRAYIACYGGFDVLQVLGSRSTDLKTHIGGMDGRGLKTGDSLKSLKECGWFRRKQILRRASHFQLPEHPWKAEAETVICVTPGPQSARFAGEGMDTFLGGTYAISPDSNRMGIRLTGPGIASVDGTTDILSDGMLSGSIQVSAGGQPIIMTADHQTTGGYAKIAVVIPSDLPVLAQLMPGARVRFQMVDEAEALRRYRQQTETLEKIRKDMKL